MRNTLIEEYLQKQNVDFDKDILKTIEANLESAQNDNNEQQANYYWFLREVFLIQSSFVDAFNYIVSNRYEDAWNALDRIDIAIGYLNQNTPDEIDNRSFNISFIGKMVKEYQKLFPYRYFLSREMIIKEEKCNICGQIRRIRHHCQHSPGKVYLGKLCLLEITDVELKAFALVTDPFDKYAVIHVEGLEYDYGMLQYLLQYIHNPYEEFFVKIEKEKLRQYKNAKRNAPCPCGSGKKYKYCHLGNNDEFFDHYVVHFKNKDLKGFPEIKHFNTWL